ncbi:hypothetical protein ACHMW7_09050 [Aminobacter sp. UC22_36]|uniref:hypothetical protein n=1 Tax=Aminobacter sp. UC22_36 TaxID=3374549 RepID=UPI0037578282
MPDEKAITTRKPAPNYRDPNDSVSQKAAENRKPADGNTEPVDETNDKTRHADGQNPPNPGQPNFEKPGGSEQPGYRMKRAHFWQS